jgi:hypothetical protein
MLVFINMGCLVQILVLCMPRLEIGGLNKKQIRHSTCIFNTCHNICVFSIKKSRQLRDTQKTTHVLLGAELDI